MKVIATLGLGGASALWVFSCGGSGSQPFPDSGGPGMDAAQAGDMAILFEDSSPHEAGPPVDAAGDDCPANAKLIYITGIGAELWSFWPPTFTFKKIGVLSCESFPTHMTVDRNGWAWVVGSGNIYKTSTVNATCTADAKWTSQSGFGDFALSFVGLTSTDTTLYLLGDTSLGSFDVVTGAFKVVGTPSVPSTFGDMTSNGDGTLYFLNDAPTLNLYNLSPTNAQVQKTYTIGASGGGDQALAYFGGRFYAFESGVIYEYDPVMKTTKNIGNAPISVTGAGQSTCVPTQPTDAGPPN